MTRPRTELHKDPLVWVMIGLHLLSIVGIFAAYVAILWKVDTSDRIGQVFAIRMLQVTLGMMIGATMTFLGLIAAWFGLTQEMSGECEAKEFKRIFAAASPGAVLILAGMAVLFLCLTKDVAHSSHQDGVEVQEPLRRPEPLALSPTHHAGFDRQAQRED